MDGFIDCCIGCACMIGCCMLSTCYDQWRSNKKHRKHSSISAFILEDSTPIDHSEETEIFRKLQGTHHIKQVSDVKELTPSTVLCVMDKKNFVQEPKFPDAVTDMSNRQITVTGRQFAFVPKQTSGNEESQNSSSSTEHSVMKMRQKNGFDGMYYLMKEDDGFTDTGPYGSGSGFMILKINEFKKNVEIVHLFTGQVFIWNNMESVLTLPPAPGSSSLGNNTEPSGSQAAGYEKGRSTEVESPLTPLVSEEPPPPTYDEACDK